jgi:hypothetical protein
MRIFRAERDHPPIASFRLLNLFDLLLLPTEYRLLVCEAHHLLHFNA